MRVELAGGEVVELGATETTPTVGIIDYSKRVTDDFGVTTVVERGFARRMSVRMLVPFDEVDALQRRLASLRATSALWVADDRFASLSFDGFYKDFQLDLAVPPTSFCTLTVEGLTASEPFTDPGGDPAPAGMPSTLRLLDPVPVTGGMLVASSVAETDYPEWAPGTSYALGDRVIKAATHRIYESAAGANVGNDPAGTSGKWIDVGATNRWAMFDQALGSLSSWGGSIAVTLAPGTTINAVALLDVTAATVRVQAAGYDQTRAVTPGTLIFDDMPATSDSVTVTIAGPGSVSVGTLMIGPLRALGITEASPSAGITDYSRKEVDDFGEVAVVQRAWAKRMTAAALIRTDALDLVANRIASVRGRPSLWIGQAGLDSLTVYGFFKNFSIEAGESVSKLSLSIEGLSVAAKIEPLTVVVDWEAVADPVGTKPADNATVGAPAGTRIDDKYAQDVVAELTAATAAAVKTSTSLMSLLRTTAVQQAYEQARSTLEGKPIGTVIVDVREVGESTVETLSLIGAKNGDGTAFVLDGSTVMVTPTESLAQTFDQIEANTSDNAALIQDVQTAVTDEASARATAITGVYADMDAAVTASATSITTAYTTADTALGTRVDGVTTSLDDVDASVTSLTEALVTPEGGHAKAVLSLDVDGHISGYRATNDGSTSTFDILADVFTVIDPGSGDPHTVFSIVGGQVRAYDLEVDTLKVNTAVEPLRVVSTTFVAGTYSSTTGTASPRAAILTASIVVTAPGWVEVSAKFLQGIVGTDGPWSAAIAMDGTEDAYSFVGGGSEQDNVETQGAFYCASAGTYTITLLWAAYSGIQIRQRSMFVKFFVNTE